MIYDNNIWNIDTLALSSGGVNGVMFLGSAVILKELNILEGIKHFIGCSAGAIVAGLLACEVDPKEILEEGLYLEICDWNNNLKPTEGLIKAKKLKELLYKHFGNKTLSDIPRRLTFSTLNLTKNKTVYIDTKTHPEMKLLDAVLMSSSIPLFFPCFLYEGDYFVDGAITDSFPINLCENKTNVLGIYIDIFNTPQQDVGCLNNGGLSSFPGFVKMIFSSVIKELLMLRNTDDYTILRLNPEHDNNNKSVLSLIKISPEHKVRLFHSGIDNTKRFIYQEYERRNMLLNDPNPSSSH